MCSANLQAFFPSMAERFSKYMNIFSRLRHIYLWLLVLLGLVSLNEKTYVLSYSKNIHVELSYGLSVLFELSYVLRVNFVNLIV